MKTLVIHPDDHTTRFLNKIYKDKDWTIITHNISHHQLYREIMDHDRIIMLGHGTPQGLIGHGRYIITSKLVYLLRDKYCICIWCNADEFVKKYELKGLYSGMIISETDEAYYFGVTHTLDHIKESNKLFTNALTESIGSDNIIDSFKGLYNNVSNPNPIISYNENNLYYNLNNEYEG